MSGSAAPWCAQTWRAQMVLRPARRRTGTSSRGHRGTT